MKTFITERWQTGHATSAIATSLNREGYRTPKRKCKFTRHMVRKLLDKWGLTEVMRPQISAEMSRLAAGEWWLIDLARKLEIDKATLARWCRKGWVHARKLPRRCKWWVVWADDVECIRLTQLFSCSHGKGKNNHSFKELKVPRTKPTP